VIRGRKFDLRGRPMGGRENFAYEILATTLAHHAAAAQQACTRQIGTINCHYTLVTEHPIYVDNVNCSVNTLTSIF
jgi:hypothetical protein